MVKLKEGGGGGNLESERLLICQDYSSEIL